MFLHGRIFVIEVFSVTIVNKACSATDVVLIAIVIIIIIVNFRNLQFLLNFDFSSRCFDCLVHISLLISLLAMVSSISR